MEVVKTNSKTLQKPVFKSNNKQVKLSQTPQMQNNEAEITLPNLSPQYFHPSFCAKNPKIALYRAEQLKALYAAKNLPYLLPNEVWSDKKIMGAIKLFGTELDKLVESKTLDKKTLQAAINNLLPENTKGKIIIKDFTDFAEDFRKAGDSEEEIARWKNHTACVDYRSDINTTTLYLNCSKLFRDKLGTVDFKSDAEHELKHALAMTLTNVPITDIYKNEYGKCTKQSQIFKAIFNLFGQSFRKGESLAQTSLTPENMFKWQEVNSIDDLHAKFETTINLIIEKAKNCGRFKINSQESWKHFFTYLKHSARDEKEAYQSNKRYREVYDDLGTPTTLEFKPLLFAEMEKFFAKKAHDC